MIDMVAQQAHKRKSMKPGIAATSALRRDCRSYIARPYLKNVRKVTCIGDRRTLGSEVVFTQAAQRVN